jgi:exodeoxyribonuclease V alpha subunit
MTLPLDYFFAERVLKDKGNEEYKELLALLLARSREGHLAINTRTLDESLALAAKTLPELPCVIKEGEYLYLQKNFHYQQEIADHLMRLMKSEMQVFTPPLELIGNIEQQAAIHSAYLYPVTLLLGGPGTGKTYTAAQIIKTFAEQGCHIALAAPTGKAVAQLESYVRPLIPEGARVRYKTLHALLKETPYEQLVLVDECSMIDARLFAGLLSALQSGTRLILVGDPDQLPPVEVGSIFSDIAAAVEEGFTLPCTRLTTCLRTEHVEIADFATCIRTSDLKTARTLLTEQKIGWVDLSLDEASKKRIYPMLFEHVKNGVCLLSCLRQGPFGVDALNAYFQEESAREGAEAFPILITESDHALQLYNGDLGTLMSRSPSELTLNDYALFPDRKNPSVMRKIPALALPTFEMAYCLSVHKSQGSEYTQVFVLIPKGSENFGREMLYTAATRAKRKVTFCGALDEILKVIEKSARKLSGLSAKLKENMESL